MNPVRQTKDNCMAACWASILEVPLDVVPDYQAIRKLGGLWLNAINVWLSKHHGVTYEELERRLTPHFTPVGWHLTLVGVPSAPDKIDGGHAIVAFSGVGVWDPARGDAPPRPTQADKWGVLVELDETRRQIWRPQWGTCLCGPCLRDEPYPTGFAEARCINCQCTDSNACPGGCSWVWVDRSKGEGLCTSCDMFTGYSEAERVAARVEAAAGVFGIREAVDRLRKCLVP